MRSVFSRFSEASVTSRTWAGRLFRPRAPLAGNVNPNFVAMTTRSRTGASARPLADVPAEEVAIIEHTLSKFIGPMAKMLVRKEMGRRGTFKELIIAVADTIDQPAQRELFLQALKRALPRRQQ